MLRSWLPVPSLLGLFGALLMLPPELLLGVLGCLLDLPTTDPGEQKAIAFAMEQYNQDRGDSGNYFKVRFILKPLPQVGRRDEYDLTMDLVETSCKKEAGKRRPFERFQHCDQLPENPEKPSCYFKVIPGSPPNKMTLETTTCT